MGEFKGLGLRGRMMRLLVIKHGALGDIIQGIDAFASLRAHFADAHISMLTTPVFAGLMEAMPYFDEVLVDKRSPIYQLGEMRRMRQIVKSGFDYIIDMQCSKRTSMYHRLFAPQGQKWLGTAKHCSHPYPDFSGVNNKDRMLQAAFMLGAPAIEGDLSFLSNPNKGAGVIAQDSPYAVLMPGCSPAKPSKKWPAAHYADLAKRLLAQSIKPVIIGTAVDKEACDAIEKACPEALNLCGKTSLSALASLCAGADICVGNDSGPVFLAAKTGAPTIMVMGPDTNPEMSAPTGAQATYLKAEALADLAADEVYNAISRLKA